LPDGVRLEAEACVPGWGLVRDFDRCGMDRRIRGAGWTFFCLAGEISATRVGFEGAHTKLRAVRQLLAGAESENFNSLEIARSVSGRFLGVPYTTVYAYARHVQQSMFLFGAKNAQPWIEEGSAANRRAGREKVKQLAVDRDAGQPSVATF
jgi:hypothetical protein